MRLYARISCRSGAYTTRHRPHPANAFIHARWPRLESLFTSTSGLPVASDRRDATSAGMLSSRSKN